MLNASSLRMRFGFGYRGLIAGKEGRKMTAKRVDTHSICDSLYHELLGMKSRLDTFISSIEHTKGKTREALEPYIRHLLEMKGYIGWKMEIFSKVCPIDWSKYEKGIEDTASVRIEEKGDFDAGGYIGG